MNIPADFYLEQAARLNALEYHRNEDGMTELARVLETASQGNHKLAEAIISAFIEDGGACPGPREISLKGWSLIHPDSREVPMGRHNCPTCKGSGWESYKVMKRQWVYTREGHEERLVPSDYAKRCICKQAEASQ